MGENDIDPDFKATISEYTDELAGFVKGFEQRTEWDQGYRLAYSNVVRDLRVLLATN